MNCFAVCNVNLHYQFEGGGPHKPRRGAPPTFLRGGLLMCLISFFLDDAFLFTE